MAFIKQEALEKAREIKIKVRRCHIFWCPDLLRRERGKVLLLPFSLSV